MTEPVTALHTPESLAAAAAPLVPRVDVQPTVVNDAGAPSVIAYCLAGAVATAVGLQAPFYGLLGLALAAASAQIDIDGGRGWLRTFVPRRGSANVLAWPATLPDLRAHSGPRLLICLPADTGRVRGIPLTLAAPGLAAAIAAVGVLVPMLAPSVGPRVALVGLAGLLVSAAGAWIAAALDRRQPRGTSGAELALSLLAALRRAPPRHLSVVVAIVGGGTLHLDGLEVLLRNHRRRLPPASTRVVVWSPGPGALAAVPQDGRISRRPADPKLLDAARRSGLEPSRPTAVAARAMRCGWRALGLTGATPTATALLRLVSELDADLSADPGSDSGADPDADPNARPGSDPGEEPGADPASKQGGEPA